MKTCIDLKLKYKCFVCADYRRHKHSITINYIANFKFYFKCIPCDRYNTNQCLAIALSKETPIFLLQLLEEYDDFIHFSYNLLIRYHFEEILSSNATDKLKQIEKMLLLK